MFVEQKQVTGINLHDGRARDISLHRDVRGYRLSLVSRDDVVNVLLSAHDLYKLRHEITKLEARDAKTDPVVAARIADPRPADVRPVASVESSLYHWNAKDWISFN